MLDQKDGEVEAVADRGDQLAQPVDLFMVQAAGGLVEQQELRLARERAGQLDALLRGEGQVRDRLLRRRCRSS